MTHTTHKLRRIWKKSPLLALKFIRKKLTRQAKNLLPREEWNINWLGEEMRPFNSLRNKETV